MEILLASSNRGKLLELQQLLAPLSYKIKNQSDYDIEDAIENGSSFIENALIKARHGSKYSGLPTIADDSGLCVDYLNGEPGIYSARYAGEPASDQKNNHKLLEKLAGVPQLQRAAHFHCTVAMVKSSDDSNPTICTGEWHGYITETPSGDNGFGYDPIFHIPEFQCTSAELTSNIKNKYSHRAQALQKLVNKLM